MKRAEFRREPKHQEKKTKTYMLTQGQIDDMKEKILKEATEKVFILMLALPLEVLITEDYWMDVAEQAIPKFIDDLLALYKAYEEGSITIEEMEEDLIKFAGVKPQIEKE